MAEGKKFTLAQRLRDPAKRKSLPMSSLSTKQQAQRRLNQRITKENANPLYDPSAVLSGHALAHAARQIAGTELDPQIAALNRQSTNTQAQQEGLQGRAKGYYQALATQELGRHDRMANLAALTSKAVGDVGAQTRQDFDTQAQADAARQAADAAQRGQGLGGGGQAEAEAAAARGRAGALQGAAETATAQQGANWTALSDTLGQAIQLRGAETQGRLRTGEANALTEIGGRRAELEGQRGGLTAKAIQDLRQSGFENQATMAGLGLKQADLQNTADIAAANRKVKYAGIKATTQTQAANRASRESTAAAGRDVTTAGQTETHRHNVAMENRPTKQANETAASLKIRRDISSARGTWRRLMAKFGGNERHVKAHMIEVMGVPPAAYNAIYDLERSGSLNPHNVAALENDLGVMVPAGWRRKPGKPAVAVAPH